MGAECVNAIGGKALAVMLLTRFEKRLRIDVGRADRAVPAWSRDRLVLWIGLVAKWD